LPNYQEQFDALNAKMDTILSLLNKEPMLDMPVEAVVAPLEEITEEIIKPKKTKAAPKAKKTSSATK
jgi:hypothetical protein